MATYIVDLPGHLISLLNREIQLYTTRIQVSLVYLNSDELIDLVDPNEKHTLLN